jgi:arginine repressor
LVTKFVGDLYKYSTGIYRSVDDALVRKNQVNALGMADAFVTVYYNGERITIERANQLIAEKGESIFATDGQGNLKQLNTSTTNNPNNTIVESNTNNTSNPTNTSNTPNSTVEVVPVSSSGRFQVDLGTYSGEAPTDIANAMLMIQQYEIKTEVNGANKRYFIGNFETEADAKKVIDLYKENGVENIQINDLNQPKDVTPSGPAPVEGVVFRVFLGTYIDGNVPQTRANTFIELAELGIVKIEDEKGETYFCGNESLHKNAQLLLNKFTERGISIAEIKAFQNGVEIPLTQAKSLIGE